MSRGKRYSSSRVRLGRRFARVLPGSEIEQGEVDEGEGRRLLSTIKS